MPQHSSPLAVVTGATRGVGAAIARRLLADGVRVIGTGTGTGTDTSTPPGAHVPAGLVYRAVDFNDPVATQRFADELETLSPDILINNAGVNKLAPFADIDTDDFVRLHRINVLAPMLLCRAVLPGMRKKRSGRIVNVCSIWSLTSMRHRGSYSATKFALHGMSSALADEVGVDNVLVNCVSPGFLDTEMLHGAAPSDEIRELTSRVPMQRLGRPEEVAELTAWLAGPLNTFVTGQNIAIDGGFTRL